MDEMKQTAKTISQDLGKLDGLSEEEKSSLYEKIGLGALKYFILKVDPKKRILFDPESSVDFAGNTGPFIQYTYARIQSLKRKYTSSMSMNNNNIEFVKLVRQYGEVRKQIKYDIKFIKSFMMSITI